MKKKKKKKRKKNKNHTNSDEGELWKRRTRRKYSQEEKVSREILYG